jgi:hypothetical protein
VKEIVGGMASIFAIQLAILVTWTLVDPMKAVLLPTNEIDFQVTRYVKIAEV